MSETLRDAVRRAVAETSLREVADEIGMSHSGLRTYIEGRRSHRATVDKVARWYHARTGRSARVRREDVDAALAVLDAYLNDRSTPAVVRERERQLIFDRLREEGR